MIPYEERWPRARIAAAARYASSTIEYTNYLCGNCDAEPEVRAAYAALHDADKPLAALTRHPFEDQARELLAKAFEAKELEKCAAPLVRAGGPEWETEITAMCAAYDAGLAKGGEA